MVKSLLKGGKYNIVNAVEDSQFYDSHGLFHNVLVLQPTKACNLNCGYCYLPDRKNGEKMNPEVVYATIESINSPTSIIWHSGEPTASGLEHMSSLIDPFQEVKRFSIGHSMQTNATLINDDWATFLKTNKFNLGVSVDGPRDLNKRRVDWKGKPAYDRIVAGMEKLREHEVPYSIISVAREETSGEAKRVYNFAKEMGARKLAINFEEVEGIHSGRGFVDYGLAKKFWGDLYDAWFEDRTVPVREIVRVHDLLNRTAHTKQLPPRHTRKVPQREIPLLPTIAVNGDVTLFSPEFINAGVEFVVGNILKEPLAQIVRRGLKSKYSIDFSKALDYCKRDCEIYDFCGGSFPSNRFSEKGRIDVMETDHCRVHDQALLEVILEKL